MSRAARWTLWRSLGDERSRERQFFLPHNTSITVQKIIWTFTQYGGELMSFELYMFISDDLRNAEGTEIRNYWLR